MLKVGDVIKMINYDEDIIYEYAKFCAIGCEFIVIEICKDIKTNTNIIAFQSDAGTGYIDDEEFHKYFVKIYNIKEFDTVFNVKPLKRLTKNLL